MRFGRKYIWVGCDISVDIFVIRYEYVWNLSCFFHPVHSSMNLKHI